jgi:hypothetical protein
MGSSSQTCSATHLPAWPAATRLEAHVTNVVDTQEDVTPREAGPAERTKLAGIFAAIGNATNATINEMPEFSDERVRRQIMHTLATVGGFVMYADILQQGTMQASSESTVAIVQLGRALSRRIEVKES